MNDHLVTWQKALLILSVWLSHVIVVLGVLASFRLIEWFLDVLWGTEGRVLFGKVPLSYIFDGADIAVLVGLLFYGMYWIFRVYTVRE